MVHIVVAHSFGGIIGNKNQLPWHLPKDLQHFKNLTTGHTVVIGRNTFDSIGQKSLPNRTLLVVSSTLPPGLHPSGAYVVSSLQRAIATTPGEMFVAGGTSLYREALPIAQMMHITSIHRHYPGDTYFPSPAWNTWTLKESNYVPADSKNEAPMSFETWVRK
jgi:dihydrofolate reductase